MKLSLFSILAVFGFTLAQRPSDVSICDYYTTALLTDDTAANQETLLILLINTAVIGNYTTPNVGVAVAGILAQPASFDGMSVNLLQYFDGALVSTNVMGVPSVVNFLDGGGAAALMMDLPAYTTTSNQYGLLTHLYEFFSVLLGCSKYGTAPNVVYMGDPSMGQVHQFMGLDKYEFGYFVEQVGLAAASFGVTAADVNYVGNALYEYFGFRCSPPMTIVPGDGPLTQAICSDYNCPLAEDPECWLYIPPYTPQPATTSAPSSSATSTSTSYHYSSKYETNSSSPYTSSSEYESSSSPSSSKYESSFSWSDKY